MNLFEQLLAIDEYVKKCDSGGKGSGNPEVHPYKIEDSVQAYPGNDSSTFVNVRKKFEGLSDDLYNIFGGENL